VLFTSAKVPADVVYRVTKALHDGRQELVATFPPFALFDPSTMAKPLQGMALHAGAEKYYREAGLLK